MRRLNAFGYAFAKYDGYGYYVQETIRALHLAGVSVMPGERQVWNLPAWIQRLQGWDWSQLTLSIMPGNELQALPGRHWGLTMTEDTSCPKDWPGTINGSVERLIVPCEQNAEAFKTQGVKVPIHVIPGGTNPEMFPAAQIPRRDRPFTFMALADRGNRKNFMMVHHAFFLAFQNNPDARLVIKGRVESLPWLNSINFPDKRVSFWRANVENPADVYAQADCYVFPSSGEGWGMPPREAACMGVPTIVTRWGGLEAGIDDWATVPLNTMTFTASTLPHVNGQWAIPDLDELVAAMRWVYDHQDEARQKALAGAAWLRANQTWEHSAKALIELMEKYA